MRGASLILLLELVASVYSAKKETAICKPPPDWSIGDEAPMRDSYSQVTVVALLQASCGFCLVQAQNMGPLRDKLANQGLTNISYIIVNDQSPMSKLLFPELKRRAPPGIPVYQQLPNQEDVWQLLDGNKDDFLIYDRCGRLTFHIRLPLSFLHFPYVEAAINATFYEDYCQNCSFYANVSYDATIAFRNISSERKSEEQAEGEPTNRKNGKHGRHQGEGHGKGEHRHPPINEEQIEDQSAPNDKEREPGHHRHHHRGEGRGKGGHRHPDHSDERDHLNKSKGKKSDQPHHSAASN